MLEGWFLWFIVFWVVVLVGLFAIGGFFMFRKFLKVFPKEDGKSTLDWEEYYVDSSIHLWDKDAKDLLEELLKPFQNYFDLSRNRKSARKSAKLRLRKKRRKLISTLLFVDIS